MNRQKHPLPATAIALLLLQACNPTTPPQEASAPAAIPQTADAEEALQLAPLEGGVMRGQALPTPRDPNALKRTHAWWSGNATQLHTSDACATFEDILHLEHGGKEGADAPDAPPDMPESDWCPNLPGRPLFWPDSESAAGQEHAGRMGNRNIWLSEWKDKVLRVTDVVQQSEVDNEVVLGRGQWLVVRCRIRESQDPVIPAPGSQATVKGVLITARAGEGIVLSPCVIESDAGMP